MDTSSACEVLKPDNWFVSDRISTLEEALVLAAVILCDNTVTSGVMPIITGSARGSGRTVLTATAWRWENGKIRPLTKSKL